MSHAEGESTIAYTTGSHAEGKSTKAGGKSDTDINSNGSYAHAEGVGSVAYGRGSHAEGENTLAQAQHSHAEGGSCEARGDYSHVEGCNNGDTKTTTSGTGAHAEGRGTTSSGSGSHSEGVGTTASNEGSHAEGKGTTSRGTASHSEGQDTTSSALGTHAEGIRTQATANAAHSEGMDSIASNSSAHAEGYNTRAQGDASHSEGNNTVSSGNSSHAEGKLSTASGDFSHAEGYGTLSTGEASHTEGRYTNAIGVGAHAEGGYLRRCYLDGAAGVYKVYDSQTSEMPSWLNGYYYNAGSESSIDGQPLDGVKIYNGNYEHIGTITSSYSETGDDLYIRVDGITGTFTTTSEDVFLIAWSKAEGTSSHSEGGGLAIGNFSHAEGSMTWAAHQSHAEGHMSASMNTGSHAEGIKTRAHGQASHSEGFNTFAAGKYSHVQGKYNLKDDTVDDEGNGKYAHIVGNGSSGNPSNAHTIDWDGNAWFAGKIKIGGISQDDESAKEVLTSRFPDWSHLKWYVMGDSLTDRNNNHTIKRYYDFVQEKTGIQIVLDGIGGTGYGAGVSNGTNFVERVKNIPDDVDIVTIFGSVNDVRYAGDIYNAAIYDTLAWISLNKPGLRVIVVPPSLCKSNDEYDFSKRGTLWTDYCDRLQVCALACDFRYVSDMYDCPPFNPNFTGHMEKFFTTDAEGIHPNEEGHKALAPYFYNALQQELVLK